MFLKGRTQTHLIVKIQLYFITPNELYFWRIKVIEEQKYDSHVFPDQTSEQSVQLWKEVKKNSLQRLSIGMFQSVILWLEKDQLLQNYAAK